MDRTAAKSRTGGADRNNLAQTAGAFLCTVGETLLKSILESELPVAQLLTPATPPFHELLELSRSPVARRLLGEHGCNVVDCETAARGVTLATRLGLSGRSAVCIVPNAQLDRAMPELSELVRNALRNGGAVCLILEDRPADVPASCPRRAAVRLGIAALEPGTLGELRDMLAVALRMSRGSAAPVALIIHDSLLRSAQTLDMRPNRAGLSVNVHRADRQRQRRLRFSESKDVLRLARRLELNSVRALPSPGERVPVGFITIGPADMAVRHLANVLSLEGRIPTLSLGLLNPLDEVAIGRILTRCEKVVVLEPRPGSVELPLLQIAERLRRTMTEPIAGLWGRNIPADDEGNELALESDEDLHPSVLVRRIQHLLHEIRPTLALSSRLAPESPKLPFEIEQRSASFGPAAAMAQLRSHLAELDVWLRDRSGETPPTQTPTVLAFDGVMPDDATPRVVTVETMGRDTFLDRGIAAIAQASSLSQPYLVLIGDFAPTTGQDVERLAKSAVPSRFADRVHVKTADVNASMELREILQEACRSDDLTVVVVRDGPPARFDPAAVARELREVDRLGFEPVQRSRWAIEEACSLRPGQLKLPIGDVFATEHPQPSAKFDVDTLAERAGRHWRLQMNLVDELVEVRRTKAPVPFWRGSETVPLPAGPPVHAGQPHWRSHLAGYRGTAPGVATEVICEAGRVMGYAVQCVYNSAPIGSGRNAWSQILFTRLDPEATKPEIVATIPFGEADLLLGLDVQELLRAVNRDDTLQVAGANQTSVVANVGPFADDSDQRNAGELQAAARAALAQCARLESALVQDIAGACRTGFYSDRVTDLVVLGAAFQRGMIPVTYAAMDAALKYIESTGIGRAVEAFDFGRRVANDPQLLSVPSAEATETAGQMRRRMYLVMARRRFGGRRRAERFDRALDQSLRGMPGLTETDSGRQTRRDFTAAFYACHRWGGLKYAERYADLIVQLYHADRADTGRSLTRAAVLPLAEAMLMRDPIYIASMTAGPEHLRRIRRQLNIKPARGDLLSRRFVFHVEAVVFNKRIHGVVRASDWIIRLLRVARYLLPHKARGSVRNRHVRDLIVEAIGQFRTEAVGNYEQANAVLHRLDELAQSGRLRTIAVSELKTILEPMGSLTANATIVGVS